MSANIHRFPSVNLAAPSTDVYDNGYIHGHADGVRVGFKDGVIAGFTVTVTVAALVVGGVALVLTK